MLQFLADKSVDMKILNSYPKLQRRNSSLRLIRVFSKDSTRLRTLKILPKEIHEREQICDVGSVEGQS